MKVTAVDYFGISEYIYKQITETDTLGKDKFIKKPTAETYFQT